MLTQTTGLDRLREHLHAVEISDRATELIVNSRQEGSLKHYESAWANGVADVLGRDYFTPDHL